MDWDPWGALNVPDSAVDSRHEVNLPATKPTPTKNSSVREIRRALGWLIAEINRLESPKQKVRSRCQVLLQGKLRHRFGGGMFSLKHLRSLRVKQETLLRIKAQQNRQARRMAQRREENYRMKREGPGHLGRRPRKGKDGASEMQIKELVQFWQDIWETKGSYNPSHPAIESWKKQTREVLGELDKSEPLSREEAWQKALGKEKLDSAGPRWNPRLLAQGILGCNGPPEG